MEIVEIRKVIYWNGKKDKLNRRVCENQVKWEIYVNGTYKGEDYFLWSAKRDVKSKAFQQRNFINKNYKLIINNKGE